MKQSDGSIKYRYIKYLIAGSLLIILSWLAGRLLVTLIYRGNAGDYLNQIIIGQSTNPLERYLSAFNFLYICLALVITALLLMYFLLPRSTWQLLATQPAEILSAARQNTTRIIAAISLTFLSAVAGVWIAWSESGIYKNWLEDTFNAASAIYQNTFRNRPLLGESDTWAHTHKRELQGLGTFLPELAQKGLTLVYGMQKAWLVDMDGVVQHTWAVDYDSLQTDKELIPRSYPETYIYWHQARLFPNGDLLVIIDQYDKSPNGLAMMKIDRDSKVLWIYPHHVHHDFIMDKQGNIYAIDQQVRNETVDGLNLELPYLDDGLLKLSPDGEKLDRISLIEAFSHSNYASFFNGNSSYNHGDYLHTNNVDILKPGLFGADSGGILLSFRELSAIAVMDIETSKITWARAGYWHNQHDPDLLENGNILLFDNSGAWHPEQYARVIEFNPESYEIVWEYPGDTGQRLFSTYRGRQQQLANGNILISEFESGRLLEVTRNGQTVWEYSCPFYSDFNPDYVCNFVGGRRYEHDSLNFSFNPNPVQ